MPTSTDTRTELTQVEQRIRSLREEKARATKVVDAAKAAATSGTEESLRAGKGALDALHAVEAEIEKAQQRQIELLRKVGDAEAGVAGFASPGLDGWAQAASELSIVEGNLRADVPASSLLRTGTGRRRVAGSPPSAEVPASNRYLYPVFDPVPFGDDPGDLAATDFVVTFSATALTGVERAPDATTQKAKLTPTVASVTVQARQHAVVLDKVPGKVFDTQEALRGILGNEMARQLDMSIDAHLVTKIEAASPPSGSTGSNLVTKIRNAIASMQALGGEPRYLALTPADAASLDLAVQPGTGDWVFNVAARGSSVPVWSLLVREVPTISHPTLIDPSTLARLYLGDAAVLVDPYSGLTTNEVRARVELEATAHVRNIVQGAYVIA